MCLLLPPESLLNGLCCHLHYIRYTSISQALFLSLLVPRGEGHSAAFVGFSPPGTVRVRKADRTVPAA